MTKFFKSVSAWTVSITTAVFTVAPESIFMYYKFPFDITNDQNLVLTRIAFVIIIFASSTLGNLLYFLFRRNVHIKGCNYNIQIKYGNLLRMKKSKKVIPFDECFTTKIGKAPADVNEDSLCGQYLKEYPMQSEDIQELLNKIHLAPDMEKSEFQHREKYTSGKLVPNEDYLLMAFAKLDKDGLGRMSRQEYLDCLFVLWEEIDKYYGQTDVCIPILGSGVTRLEDMSLTQQELLDMIIESYKLSPHKIKSPYKLYIVCKQRENFSLNRIGTTL